MIFLAELILSFNTCSALPAAIISASAADSSGHFFDLFGDNQFMQGYITHPECDCSQLVSSSARSNSSFSSFKVMVRQGVSK